MRFIAEIIGCLALLGIFSYGLYRISLSMDEAAHALKQQKEKEETKDHDA